MLKKLFLPLYFFCIIYTANAQWTTLGDTGFYCSDTAHAAIMDNGTVRADIYSTIIDKAGNIYSAGAFTNSSGFYYVAKWNGTTWAELGTGANALKANNIIYALTTDNAGNIYAAGYFTNSSGNYYVAKWNGSSWDSLYDSSNPSWGNGAILALSTDKNGNLYAAGGLVDSNNHVYVIKWDGTHWTSLGTDANAPNGGIYTLAADQLGNIYAAGLFTNGNSYYVAKWDGTTWSQPGNTDNSFNGIINTIIVDDSNNLYVTGDYDYEYPLSNISHPYIAKWNGTKWSMDTTNLLLGWRNTLALDKRGNLYAGGDHIIKWNGTNWVNLDKGNNAPIFTADSYINSIVIDSLDNVYVSGTLKFPNGNVGVAEYEQGSSVTAITNATTTTATALTAYPNPTNGNLTITTPEACQVVVYNILGELITTQVVQAGNTTISLGNVPTGIYTVLVTGQNNTYTPVKIVKN